MNCVEALAAALYICGFEEEAFDVFEGFNYKDEFFKVNFELLESYKGYKDGKEIVEKQNKYLEENEMKWFNFKIF